VTNHAPLQAREPVEWDKFYGQPGVGQKGSMFGQNPLTVAAGLHGAKQALKVAPNRPLTVTDTACQPQLLKPGQACGKMLLPRQ